MKKIVIGLIILFFIGCGGGGSDESDINSDNTTDDTSNDDNVVAYYNMYGYIKNYNEEPLQNCHVKIVEYYNGQLSHETTTNEDGYYFLENIESSDYYIYINHDDCCPRYYTILEITHNGYYNVNLENCSKDNNDGTVTHLSSGLMWTKDFIDSGTEYNSYKAVGDYHEDWNPDSFNACKNVTLGGYTDWRLPTRYEVGYMGFTGSSNISNSSGGYHPNLYDWQSYEFWLASDSAYWDVYFGWIDEDGSGSNNNCTIQEKNENRCMYLIDTYWYSHQYDEGSKRCVICVRDVE